MKVFWFVSSTLFLAINGTVFAQEMSVSPSLSQQESDFFEKKIRPALVKHCFKCHSEEGDKVKGGLLLDTRESSRAGGDTGPAVVPNDLDESLLYMAITYEDSDLEMPPKYKLDDDIIADFKTWIEMGAPDPRERRLQPGTPTEYTNTIDVEAGREHWSYQTPHKSPIPKTDDEAWAKSPIDSFVAAKRSEKGLVPGSDADSRTLIRRLSFDLTGLPPTSAEVENFVRDFQADPDKAVSDAASRMLDSQQYGERWGRHWLDVARYGESSGKEINASFPNAWRYRDYVIDSFNQDKPFDEFVTEQLAGDLLEYESDQERADHLVATGFLAIGPKGLNEQNARQFRFDLVDEQIDTTTQALLGTTVACARCHDHKFDPIPMSDYYAMAGIFLSSDTLYGTSEALQNRRITELLKLPSCAPVATPGKSLGDMINLELQRDQTKERLEDLLSEAREARRSGKEEEATRLRQQTIGIRNRLGQLDATIKTYEDDGTPISLAMGVVDRDEPFDSQILIRGEEDNPTDERIPRGFIQVVKTDDEEPIPADESGRLQLAHWITSPENPLTARVFVNRVWSKLFGEGIVSSPDNFGTTGELPSHPELLDYLAIRFIELDWSVKDLIHEIVTTKTYRMASDFNPENFEADPENRYLWRASKRRLDAESIRDATLAVSGQIDSTRPIGSVVARAGDGYVGRSISEAQLAIESPHRSVYLPIVRGLVPESLAIFDFSDPSLISGKREITTVPSQALYMMNSDFVIKSADAMARHLAQDLGLRGPELAREAFYRCYSRPPTEEEGLKTKAYIDKFLAMAKESGLSVEEARNLALTTFCQSLISSAEFRYLN